MLTSAVARTRVACAAAGRAQAASATHSAPRAAEGGGGRTPRRDRCSGPGKSVRWKDPRMSYEPLLYAVEDAIATITLNRPDTLNTIVPPMPDELEDAVNSAVRDPAVKVIVLRGAGRAFCAGFDFGDGFHHWDEALNTDGRWDAGKDFVFATAPTAAPVPKFMSMWRAPKPVIAQVHGWCVGGGSDMALCADLVIASED